MIKYRERILQVKLGIVGSNDLVEILSGLNEGDVVEY